jgi:small subunit ribosomal protein S29
MSLDRFLQLGAAPEHSHAIFNAAMAELTAPGRPPMLLTLDNFARANELTEYKSAAFKPIHAHDFHLLSWFNRHLSGEAPLPNGGAVLAAMSANNSANVPALEMRLMQIEAHQKQASGTLKPGKDLTLPFLEATGQKPSPIPAADPYVRYDERVLGLLGGREVAIKGLPVEGGVEVKRVSGVNKDEARSLMEYWAKSGMLSARIDEGVVGQKWTLSGGGIVGELERSCFKMKL